MIDKAAVEAHRQYQIALETVRTVREHAEGVLTLEDELAHAEGELSDMRRILDDAWLVAS